ncbi:MAG TPA: hypothetical protein VMS22_05440 [Candidatus Eisenbacteria bacterium]|nr:hypothetical protein [Candidatus Eisenbacteria bacterium]
MILNFVPAALVGILLALLGLRLVVRSTADLPPSAKSQHLVFGLAALGFGLWILYLPARVLWASLVESMTRMPVH